MAPVSCKIYFNYESRPSDDWTINLEYDLTGTLEGSSVDLQTESLVNAFVPMLLDNVVIDRVVWSTWVQDSDPYDPTALRTIPVGLNGLRSFIATSPVDDDLALLVRKTTASGKPGRMYIKGALLVVNITAGGGAWELVNIDVAQFDGYIDTLNAALSDYLQCMLVGAPLVSITYPATPEGVKQIPIRNYASEPISRAVTELVLVGPTERQSRQ